MVTTTSTPRDIPGIRVGHYTDEIARTGLTVIVFDDMVSTAAEARGAAPGSLNLAMLQPGMSAQRVDAILLTGGSAYGLRAADGVMQGLREAGRGLPFGNTFVPLVAGAVVFDLAVGDVAFPDAIDGRHAFEEAQPLSAITSARIGVGTGTRIGGIRGIGEARPGGFGVAQTDLGFGTVTAFAAVNAFGAPAGEGDGDPREALIDRVAQLEIPEQQNTTLIAVVTDIPCPHDTLVRLCVAAHDGLARIIVPAHTAVDGDVAFASTLKTGEITRERAMALTVATELTVEQAVRNAASLPVS